MTNINLSKITSATRKGVFGKQNTIQEGAAFFTVT
jgi:hypothetical protein